MTANREKTMADVGAAIAVADGPDSPALDILAMIARSQQADADRYFDMTQRLQDEYHATALAMQHGIGAALARRERGGTTRDYEIMVARIRRAIEAAQQHSPVHDWYMKQLVASRQGERNGGGHITFYGVHPDYCIDGM